MFYFFILKLSTTGKMTLVHALALNPYQSPNSEFHVILRVIKDTSSIGKIKYVRYVLRILTR